MDRKWIEDKYAFITSELRKKPKAFTPEVVEYREMLLKAQVYLARLWKQAKKQKAISEYYLVDI